MSRVEQMASLLQDHSSDRIVNGYEPNERAWMVFITMKKYDETLQWMADHSGTVHVNPAGVFCLNG